MSATSPLIAQMAIDINITPNILGAPTRIINEKVYGNMLSGISGGDEKVKQAMEYLQNTEDVITEEVRERCSIICFQPEVLAETAEILKSEFLLATWETVYVTVISTLFAVIIGMPLGVLLVAGEKRRCASSSESRNENIGYYY